MILDDDICHTSCDNHDILFDVNNDACSCGLICTSCIDLENEVLALKRMRDDMSAKLIEHNEMSANLVVLVIALNMKMRFWSQDAGVFVLSL